MSSYREHPSDFPQKLLPNMFNRNGANIVSSPVEALLSSNISATVEYFKVWREYTPNIENIVSEVFNHIDFSEKSKSIISAAAMLASEENINPYHDNEHFLEVFSLSLMLGNHEYSQGRISESYLANLLTASLLHDYKHDGAGNNGQQFRLEQIAVDTSKETLIQAGATEMDLSIIEAMVLGTDVSKDFGDPKAQSPADTLKLYNAGNIDHVHEKLAVLEERGLVDVALMLGDSDVGSNFLSVDLLNQNSEKLEEEMGIPNTLQGQQFFLEKICMNKLHSNAGQVILGSSMEVILHHCFPNQDIFARTPL